MKRFTDYSKLIELRCRFNEYRAIPDIKGLPGFALDDQTFSKYPAKKKSKKDKREKHKIKIEDVSTGDL